MEALEDMRSRHRKEQEDLQSRILQKKKGASKKTRKGVNIECEDLERQLKEKHEAERTVLEGEPPVEVKETPDVDESVSENQSATPLNGVTEALQNSSISEPAQSEDGQTRKRNRQKERLARRAAEQEAALEEAKKEAANQPNSKEIERKKMVEQFEWRRLTEKTIRPDGHCLFSAFADQLSEVGIALSPDGESVREDQRYKVVRQSAARYIETHPDDFVAWLDEPLERYVEKIRDTAEWGGHLELLALSKSYNVEICVIQDGEPQTIEPGTEGAEKICLAYYRHGFGLGEHYNSLRKSP
ncbi:hypothetical protein BJ878DRAFT_127694 [Calycina marina]|uniref:OTU domain-containing protein n=1 Tax=Calycina marina TaxID=1763456 RepID=A0A9P8CFE8_9HELO|nr:hypothetical protein BJ878DRAFT_127694 [Calycina marina]